MSTDWGYVCQSHHPHLHSTDSWFQNASGKAKAIEVYQAVRAGQWPTDKYDDPMPVVQDGYETQGPVYWLRKHLACRVALLDEYGNIEQLDDAGDVTVVHEWHVTGEPGPIGGGTDLRYPTYLFVYRSDDQRWRGEAAEATARGFVERMHSWDEGPHLHHRTVTYAPLEPVDFAPASPPPPGQEPPSNVVSLTIRVRP